MRKEQNSNIMAKIIADIFTFDNALLSTQTKSCITKNKQRTWGFCFGVCQFFVLLRKLKLMEGINKQMDNLILQTVIFILKDKETKKPVVVTHFTGFDDEIEAQQFTEFLKDQFTTPLYEDFDYKNKTLHQGGFVIL